MEILFVLILIGNNGTFEQFEYPVTSWEACLESIQFTRGVNLNTVIKDRVPNINNDAGEYRAVVFCTRNGEVYEDIYEDEEDYLSKNSENDADFNDTLKNIRNSLDY
jgi:hypothetical protein